MTTKPKLDPKKRVVLREGAPAFLQSDADAINAFLDLCDIEDTINNLDKLSKKGGTK